MPNTLDVSDDFELFDNTEYVTFRSLNSDGRTFTETPDVLALARSERTETRTIPNGGRKLVRVKTWHLKAGDLPDGQKVKYGDQIVTAASETWLIDIAVAETWKTRWRCQAWKLA
jgi:hypothetical protein